MKRFSRLIHALSGEGVSSDNKGAVPRRDIQAPYAYNSADTNNAKDHPKTCLHVPAPLDLITTQPRVSLCNTSYPDSCQIAIMQSGHTWRCANISSTNETITWLSRWELTATQESTSWPDLKPFDQWMGREIRTLHNIELCILISKHRGSVWTIIMTAYHLRRR